MGDKANLNDQLGGTGVSPLGEFAQLSIHPDNQLVRKAGRAMERTLFQGNAHHNDPAVIHRLTSKSSAT